ncbi:MULTISPECIES: NAD(P)/FAD-dependent oxidoreductase [unclassified Microbacterium]|uniref:phytoene desaturase family protein n=1 Tax=unclassified Microbacterium TaxID=2609290 RepID=UPI00214CB3D8|nr:MULTISPECIES: NAD(P)/FAD-dependent oxidoreductase [unclassified Microbacterium]MCR2783020.1 NAD(P)/FAD-dependent oxidoreductase [Microbacterium sp. zg.B96]MDL5352208.1 NAD(P)/FAD-dependent oxidoreductase [Microbacterium sp. zg-YB36]WIM16094.1 NAD(P)/FAD-dependent oxidoreductase [Microbacterium sp. zg-B96]
MTTPDVVVVGSGPNGLAAAVTLARAGLAVRVYERAAQPGGGSRTQELTLPGFRHDVCSAVHPLAVASPFFRAFGLAHRVELITPEVSFAHPLPGGAGVAYRDLDRTAQELGRDGRAYRRLLAPLATHAFEVAQFTGSNLLGVPRHPLTAVRFGLRALAQGSPLWNVRFSGAAAPAMITGVAAHAIVRQPSVVGAGAGLALQAHAHAGGWPIPRGGSQAIVDALIADLVAHGGEVVTDHEVTSLRELPPARATLLDVTPRAFLGFAGDDLPAGYRRALEAFRYGNAAAKVDFALSGPVPWSDPRVAKAGTVHLGGTRAEIARAENDVARGRHAAEPYVLVSQPSVLDDTRAPRGAHTLWAYTHVPAGSTVDQREAIVRTIERAAPGFRDLILDSHSVTAADLPEENPNYIDGDISAGAASLRQLLRRPVVATDPWHTPLPGVYLCGASTVPGPGVHGLSGWYAARSALRRSFGIRTLPSLAPE